MSDRVVIVQCPQCDCKAHVLEHGVDVLLERWRRDHEGSSPQAKHESPTDA